MAENEQYEGFLIRHRVDGNTLVLVLEDCQEGFPPDLSQEVREIVITDFDQKALDHEGLKKSEGDNFWVTIKKGSVEIGADFMPEQNLIASNVKVIGRPHDITDLRALYTVMQSLRGPSPLPCQSVRAALACRDVRFVKRQAPECLSQFARPRKNFRG